MKVVCRRPQIDNDSKSKNLFHFKGELTLLLLNHLRKMNYDSELQKKPKLLGLVPQELLINRYIIHCGLKAKNALVWTSHRRQASVVTERYVLKSESKLCCCLMLVMYDTII